MEDIDKKQKYENLKRFFKADSKMKETLIRIAPESPDDYSEESRMKYTDKLLDELKGFEIQFLQISKDMGFGDETQNALKEKFSELQKKFLISKYDSGVGTNLYKDNFSNMNEDLVEEIKDTFVGYTSLDTAKLTEFIKQASSVNELLHIFHSYIINNEQIMQSMPLIDSKINNMKYPINWYGEETELSRTLFKKFPMEMDVGTTDIISKENKILMMVRDRGHALTIDIDEIGEDTIIKYFIPKLCNIEMIKKLPGVNKISETTATGVFDVPKDKMCETLLSFIEKVPMDSDMPIFSMEEIKETVKEEGPKGRKISNIKRTIDKVKEAFRKLIQKFSKDKGEEGNDNSSRDV